jgi:hypothetical protein
MIQFGHGPFVVSGLAVRQGQGSATEFVALGGGDIGYTARRSRCQSAIAGNHGGTLNNF